MTIDFPAGTGSSVAHLNYLISTSVSLDSSQSTASGPPLLDLASTGGEFTLQIQEMLGTGSELVICSFPEPASSMSTASPLNSVVANQLAAIRAGFDLSITQLARIVGVERPTIYSWIRNERTPQAVNRERLVVLSTVSQAVQELIEAPVPSHLLSYSQGHGLPSLLELLSAESPEPQSIADAIASLDPLLVAVESNDGFRSVAAGLGRRLAKVKDSDVWIDTETGRFTG